VKPRVAIAPGASATHGIHQSDVATASPFADIWPKFQAFCGSDVIVAHNGYEFDFKILQRMAKELGKRFDLMVYPNRTHSISEGKGTSLHLYTLIARYILENL
jgi:DNA polymerase III epsilon subunit-like protein